MESVNNPPEKRLLNEPYFEDNIHCESWIDEALNIIEFNPPKNITEKDLTHIKSDFEYAKILLNSPEFVPREEINSHFKVLTRKIHEESFFCDLGDIYTQVWTYLRKKKSIENQY